MPGYTTYWANKLLGHGLGLASYSMPSGLYVKLHVADPGDTGEGYPAAPTTRAAATLSLSGVLATLSADLSWTSSARQIITHVSVWDASTGGHCLFTAALEEPKNIYSGDTFTLPTLSVSLEAAA